MSEVKVNKISPRSGTEVTLGDSGDTFTIPSGATINNQGTATNFGATGAASWTTTVKTTTFTAVAGEGYFVNTTGGAVTVNLPAGTAGAVVAIKDYANTFGQNNCTIDANGSDKIGGSTDDAILSDDGIAVTLIFIDSTRGWLVTDDGLQSSADNNPFIVATGGTVTTCGNDKIHTFTGPGTFALTEVASVAANNQLSYLVVAGGGGGASTNGNGQGGGGAGGFREDKSPVTPYTASPLDGAPEISVTASPTSFPITVGGGGSGGSAPGKNPGSAGSSSVFSTVTSAGGGLGAANTTGGNGGSGGGGGGCVGPPAPQGGGNGNTPPTSPAQGNNGGSGMNAGIAGGGGGGGALGVGGNSPPGGAPGGNGGLGATTGISGSGTGYSGGGGGGSSYGSGGTGGTGTEGGGAGAGGNPGGSGNAGTANRGGGGGGASTGGSGGTGGSGVVIIRYKFQ